MCAERYIHSGDPLKLFARDAHGRPYYARNAAGNEIYPVLDGRPVFLKTHPPTEGLERRETSVYARKRSGDEYYPVGPDGAEWMSGGSFARNGRGERFYPKDADGNEYTKEGEYIFVGSVLRYPLSARGRPLYPTHPVTKRPYYVYDDAYQIYSIGTDRDGNPVYAQVADENGELNDAYPPDQSYAYSKDGVTPLYAKNFYGEVLFPTCDRGNEHYLRHRETLEDFIEDDDLVRYARDWTDREVYPRKLHYVDGVPTSAYEVLIGNRYALDAEHSYYYPLDPEGHEYYLPWSASTREEDVIVRNRYALSRTGHFILPQKEDAAYISSRILPSIGPENITGLLERGFGGRRDYQTNVFSNLSPRTLDARAMIPDENVRNRHASFSPAWHWGWMAFQAAVLLSWIAYATQRRSVVNKDHVARSPS